MKPKRVCQTALSHLVVRSNTGFAGISKGQVRGHMCLRVSWREGRNARRGTTIYYTDEESYAQALRQAREIRFEQLARRVKEEGRIVPC